KGDPYELVIIDLMMPDMDGFALANAIGAEPRLPTTKLILLTAYDAKGLGQKAVNSGFSAYLTKPVKRAHLLHCISQVISLPAKSDQSANLPEPIEIAPGKRPENGKRILVAEDNPVNQKVTLLQLRRLGFAAQPVSTGKAAVELALEDHFHLILMDCHMPEMDGFEATSSIRKNESMTGHHVPIIGLTAQAMAGDREKCIAAGMDDYLSKPVTLDKLDTAIQRWLYRDGLTKEHAAQGSAQVGSRSMSSGSS